jgi:hypothetical protein
MEKFEYFVMDGRARFNPADAAVYEALGQKRPSDKYLNRDWSGMGAVLVRAPVVNEGSGGCSTCGDFEYLRDIT